MVILIAGGIWEQHLNGRVVKQGWKQILPDIWHSIFHHQELNCLLVVYVHDFKMAGPSANMEKHGQASEPQSTLAILSHMTAISAVCIGSLRTSDCPHRHTHLHSPLMPSNLQQHSMELRTGGSMMKSIKHGSGTMCNPENDCTSRVMRGERVAVKIQVVLLSLTKRSH